MQTTQKTAPAHAAVWGDGTLRTLLSIFLPQLRLEGQTMKLQANAGKFALVCWWSHVGCASGAQVAGLHCYFAVTTGPAGESAVQSYPHYDKGSIHCDEGHNRCTGSLQASGAA